MSIKLEVLRKLSFESQILFRATDFCHEVILARPEMFSCAFFLQEFSCNRRDWSPLNGDHSDLSSLGTWLLMEKWDLPNVRRIVKREFLEIAVSRLLHLYLTPFPVSLFPGSV